MSVRAVEWALYEADIPDDGPDHGARLTLIALADSANRDTHMAWLGLRRLALATHRSEDQARRYLRHLEQVGLIVNAGAMPDEMLPPMWRGIRPDRRPNIYRLVLDATSESRGGMDAAPHGRGLASDGPRGGMEGVHGVASDATRTKRRTEGTLARAGARENPTDPASSSAADAAATSRRFGDGADRAMTPGWDQATAERGSAAVRAALGAKRAAADGDGTA